MSPRLRLLLTCVPALLVIVVAASLAKPAILVAGLLALPTIIASSLLGRSARDVRLALAATLAALGVRLAGAVGGAIFLTLVFAPAAPAAIAILGLCLVGGLAIDTWAAWHTASVHREPLHA